MKKNKRFLAVALSLAMLMVTMPLTAFASETSTIGQYEMAEVYKEELREMGFSNSQIDELTRITRQLAKTTNARACKIICALLLTLPSLTSIFLYGGRR